MHGDMMGVRLPGRLGGGGRIIFKWTLKTWDGNIEWIDLACDRDR